jgi:hypothetical protein
MPSLMMPPLEDLALCLLRLLLKLLALSPVRLLLRVVVLVWQTRASEMLELDPLETSVRKLELELLESYLAVQQLLLLMPSPMMSPLQQLAL